MNIIFYPIESAFKKYQLLKNFVSRDIRGKFAGTFGGVLWTLINPLCTIIVYMFIFSIVIRVQVSAHETGTDSFLIYFLTGLFPWLIFAESLNRSLDSLIGNSNLITKVVFPIELLPTSSLMSSLIINGIGMCLFIFYLVTQGYFSMSWLWLSLIVPMQVFFCWGLVLFFSSLCVFIRDLKELITIFLMIWFYATPIIYPISLVPDKIRSIMMLNPMAILIELYRSVLLKNFLPLESFILFVFLSLISYTLGAIFFIKSKPALADVI